VTERDEVGDSDEMLRAARSDASHPRSEASGRAGSSVSRAEHTQPSPRPTRRITREALLVPTGGVQERLGHANGYRLEVDGIETALITTDVDDLRLQEDVDRRLFRRWRVRRLCANTADSA